LKAQIANLKSVGVTIRQPPRNVKNKNTVISLFPDINIYFYSKTIVILIFLYIVPIPRSEVISDSYCA